MFEKRLVKRLGSSNKAKAAAAYSALARPSNRNAIEPLLAALAERSVLRHLTSTARVYAVQALGVIGDPRAVDQLRRETSQGSCDGGTDASRHAAVVTLGRIGDPRAVGAVRLYLTRAMTAETRDAVEVLTGLGGENAVEVLYDTLAELAKADRKSAYDVVLDKLVEIGDSQVSERIAALLEEFKCSYGPTRQALVTLGHRPTIEAIAVEQAIISRYSEIVNEQRWDDLALTDVLLRKEKSRLDHGIYLLMAWPSC